MLEGAKFIRNTGGLNFNIKKSDFPNVFAESPVIIVIVGPNDDVCHLYTSMDSKTNGSIMHHFSKYHQ